MSDEREDLRGHLQGLATTHEVDFRASSLARRLLRHSRGGNILDAGCGTGLLSLALLRAGCTVTAIDHETAMVELTNETFRKGGFSNVRAEQLALEHLDRLGGDPFDEIYCCDVIEHVEDDLRATVGMREELAPGGRLILTVPAWPCLFGERDRRMGHYRRYSRRALRVLLRRAGFDVESLRWWNLSGLLVNVLFVRLLRLRPSEKFRYERGGLLHRIRRFVLSRWFHGFENHVPVPCGLTLIAVARPRDTA